MASCIVQRYNSLRNVYSNNKHTGDMRYRNEIQVNAYEIYSIDRHDSTNQKMSDINVYI